MIRDGRCHEVGGVGGGILTHWHDLRHGGAYKVWIGKSAKLPCGLGSLHLHNSIFFPGMRRVE
jgi:hypothetical protein